MALPADIEALGCTRSYVPGERPGWHYRIRDGEFECWDTWNVPHSVLRTFLDIVAGTVEIIGDTAARRVPLRNADFENALAYDVQGDNEGWNRTTNARAINKCKVMYDIPAFPTSGDDAFIRKSTTSGTRAMQLPPALTGLTYWTTDNIPTLLWNFELVNLAEIDVDTWAQFQGYRNTTTWRGKGPGTVKFIPPTSFEQRTVLGNRQYQAQFGFEICRIPWDQEYNEAGTLVSMGFPPHMDFQATLGV